MAAAALIIYGGSNLSRYGDVISEKSGLGRAWVGLVLIASITSLPELITGISSVAVAGVVDIAVGDVMGSCVFNLLILAMMDPMHGTRPIFLQAGQGHILSAAFAVAMLAVASTAIMGAGIIPSVRHISLITPVIILIYIVGMRTLFFYEKQVIREYVQDAAVLQARYKEISFRAALVFFALNAFIVVIAATFLPFIADEIAKTTGLGRAFTGSVFVALATSLPEVVVSIAAIRIGALDMAVANMFGSNMFNVLVLAVDDIFYTKGPIYAGVSKSHSITGGIAILMTAIAIMALVYRPRKKKFLRFEWGTFSILLLGILNFLVLFLLRNGI